MKQKGIRKPIKDFKPADNPSTKASKNETSSGTKKQSAPAPQHGAKKRWYLTAFLAVVKFFGAIFGAIADFFDMIFSAIGRFFSSFTRRERRMGVSFSVVVLALLTVAIVQTVRIGDAKKELRSVRATSAKVLTPIPQDGNGVTDPDLLLHNIPDNTKKNDSVTPLPTKPPAAPTLSPTPTVIPFVVCIDAGHGDWDGGATLVENGEEVQIEAEDNLIMAKNLKEAFLAYPDVQVIMTRETDIYLELDERTDIANKANADLLVSFHRNSVADKHDPASSSIGGVEFWLHNNMDENVTRLAESMMEALQRVGITRNRGIKYGSMSSTKENYAINRYSNMPSMIIELGFVTNPEDNKNLEEKGKDYAKELSAAIYDWLLDERETKKAAVQ